MSEPPDPASTERDGSSSSAYRYVACEPVHVRSTVFTNHAYRHGSYTSRLVTFPYIHRKRTQEWTQLSRRDTELQTCANLATLPSVSRMYDHSFSSPSAQTIRAAFVPQQQQPVSPFGVYAVLDASCIANIMPTTRLERGRERNNASIVNESESSVDIGAIQQSRSSSQIRRPRFRGGFLLGGYVGVGGRVIRAASYYKHNL